MVSAFDHYKEKHEHQYHERDGKLWCACGEVKGLDATGCKQHRWEKAGMDISRTGDDGVKRQIGWWDRCRNCGETKEVMLSDA